MLAICRRVDPYTGSIRVYEVSDNVTDELIQYLHLRSLVAQNERYFVVRRDFWVEPNVRDDIKKWLTKKDVTAIKMKELFSMIEL